MSKKVRQNTKKGLTKAEQCDIIYTSKARAEKLKGMLMKNVAIEKAIADKAKLALEYDVSPSAVVWCGDNRYIVVKDGKEIKI